MFDFYIDRGGTFTDFFVRITHPTSVEYRVFKILSQSPNYLDGPTEGIKQLCKSIPYDIRSITMGTTLVTNALLEKSGSRCALLVTKGFRDILQIANQTRPRIFDLTMKKHEVLYSQVEELEERIGFDIKDVPLVLKEINDTEVYDTLVQLKSQGFLSIAVAFLHSSIYPNHEERVKKIATELGFQNISLSSEVSNTVKIVPRGQTAVLDAYVNLIIKQYLLDFHKEMQLGIQIRFMMSDGGLCESKDFLGCKALNSGPAGGVVGMISTSKVMIGKLNKQGCIGFDMGGTSTDVSVFYPNIGVDIVQESIINGIDVQSPCFDINTIAAGGGSRLFFEQGMFKVGPLSSGALPGPVCYGRNGHLSVTDANLLLANIDPVNFPHIFGPQSDQPLYLQLTIEAFEVLTKKINYESEMSYSPKEVAQGFIAVANEAMCRAIRQMTSGRGKHTVDHMLYVFGGAGSQHCTALATQLSIDSIYIHKYASVLSAYGLSLAKMHVVRKEIFQYPLSNSQQAKNILNSLQLQNHEELIQKYPHYLIQHQLQMDLRYQGSDYYMTININEFDQIESQFIKQHLDQFGFTLQKQVQIGYLRVISVAEHEIFQEKDENFTPLEGAEIKYPQSMYLMADSMNEMELYGGPMHIISQGTTIVVEEGWSAQKTSLGNILILSMNKMQQADDTELFDPIKLSIFGNRFMSIAEQMGRALQKTAISTNIKERLDYSCAIFGPDGSLIANAPHLPVHLGSMSDAVKFQKQYLGNDWKEGDVILSNHPAAGGSHLPDLTVISPCYIGTEVVFYVAARGHHADVGGISPGSMPSFSKKLSEEGVAIKSFKLVERGVFQNLEQLLLEPELGTRNLPDNICDLQAQVSACNKGIQLIKDFILEQGLSTVQRYMIYIRQNAEESVRSMLVQISLKNHFKEVEGIRETEYMDDGSAIQLELTIDRNSRSVVFDFTGTSAQVNANINCPPSVTKSAIIYCLRSLIDLEIPLNQGCLEPAKIILPQYSLLDPSEDAAIVGGNVLTSQRITDIILKCFRATAGSQGCMNNFTFGDKQTSYYETIAGGGGAGQSFDGESGVQVHMTNTRITDIEVIERRYPVRVSIFTLRQGSGGRGRHNGGEGVIREFYFLKPMQVSLLTERRVFCPFGMCGGESGMKGRNTIIKENGQEVDLGGKMTLEVQRGESIRIETPGGGGYGNPQERVQQKQIQSTLEKGSLYQYKLLQESS